MSVATGLFAPVESPRTTVANVDVALPAAQMPPVVQSAGSMTDLLFLAVERGVAAADLRELVALHREMNAMQAVKDFAGAMASFQAACPPIKKNSTAKIVTRGGSDYSYAYAELDDIARVVNPILAKHGMSYGWDSQVAGNTLTCTCTVRHAAGHTVSAQCIVPVENPSAMNPQQKVGAALTFAQRRALSSVLGLTTTDQDTDGTAYSDPVSAQQAALINDLLAESGANVAQFLTFMNVTDVKEIQAVNYVQAVNVLKSKLAKKQKDGGK
jgi:hypothetical protein